MTEVHELHRCGMGPMCRAAVTENGRRLPAQMMQPQGLCDSCSRFFERMVRGLPHSWLKLELTLGEHRSVKQEQTRKPKPGSRVPINVTTDALMRDMENVLQEAAGVVGLELNVRPIATIKTFAGRQMATRASYRRVQKAANLIAPNLDKLLAQDHGIEMVKRLWQLQRTATRHLGETAQREKLHLPCPACKALGLVKEVQDRRGREYHSDEVATPEVVRCTRCDGEWTDAEYKWLSTMVTSATEEADVELAKWLLAEAHWQRDCALWLAAERADVLATVCEHLGLPVDFETLIGRVKA